MAYKSFILFPENSTVSIFQAKEVLEDYYISDERDISIKNSEKEINLTIDDWSCSIFFNSEPYIIEESQEMAENFAQERDDKEIIASSSKRFEIIGDEDFEMKYFNDYIAVIQELGSFEGAKVWEQAQQAFL